MGQMDMQNMQPVPGPQQNQTPSVTPAPARVRAMTSPVRVTSLSDVADLPFTVDNGVKVFNLVAEPVKQVIIPGSMGRTFDLWGFNGSAPGPTIQANEGDRVRIVFDNHLPRTDRNPLARPGATD